MPKLGHLKPLGIVVLTLAVTCICASEAFAGPAGWNTRTQIVIDNSTLTSDLTNFPMVIALEDGTNFDSSLVQSDGDDIRLIASDDTTELNFEFESAWDDTPGATNRIWVQVDSIPAAGTDAFFFVYYNNTSASASTVDPVDTWSENFVAVFHMDEDPMAGGAVVENSAGTTDANIAGGANGPPTAEANGIVGACYNFPDTNDHYSVPNSTVFDPSTTSFTVSAWVTLDNAKGDETQTIVQQINNDEIYLARDVTPDDNTVYTDVHNIVYNPPVTGTISPDSTWHHLAVTSTFDAGTATATVAVYQDGVLISTDNPAAVPVVGSTQNFRVGAHDTPAGSDNEDWDGFIDEVWFSTDAKSADWMRAHYLNVTDPTFLTYFEAVGFDTTLTSSGLLSEPLQIDSVTSSTSPQSVFDFQITDTSTYDNVPTLISQIDILVSGTADPTEHTWRLTGPDAVAIVPTVSGSPGAVTLSFENLSISVADGAAETYTLTLQTSTSPTGTPDASTFIFSIVDTDLTQPDDQASTLLATGQAAVNNGAGLEFEVVATEIVVTTQPSTTETLDVAFDMAIAYVDANGSIDLDVVGDIVTVTRSDDGSQVTVTNDSVSAGQLSFTSTNSITLSAPSAGGLQLTFTDDNIGSIDLSTNPVSSNAFSLTGAITLTALDADETSGPVSGGNSVTILGSNLGAVTFVSFAGKSADIQSASASQVIVTAPAQTSALVADVFVTDGSSSATLSDAYTYGEPDAGIPVLTSALPDSGSITGGNSVSLTGFNLSNTFSVTFGGVTAAVETITPTLVTVFVPASTINGTGPVDIVLTDSVLQSTTLVDGYTYIAPPVPNNGRDVSIINCSLHRNTDFSGIIWATLLGLILTNYLYRHRVRTTDGDVFRQ